MVTRPLCNGYVTVILSIKNVSAPEGDKTERYPGNTMREPPGRTYVWFLWAWITFQSCQPQSYPSRRVVSRPGRWQGQDATRCQVGRVRFRALTLGNSTLPSPHSCRFSRPLIAAAFSLPISQARRCFSGMLLELIRTGHVSQSGSRARSQTQNTRSPRE